MRVTRVLALSALLCAGLAPPAVAAPAEVAPAPAGTHSLSVDLSGDGGGTVTSSPDGIDCGTETFECFADFDAGTEVRLTVAADPLSTFVGWDGACTGAGACVVTMDEDLDVVAEFDAIVLGVTLDGDGVGAVTSAPGGITCDEESFDCWEAYAPGTVVTLTATPSDTTVFLGWDGACTGTGDCVVSMTDDVEITAEFDTMWLGVEIQGDGTGAVTSDPPGIDCGGDDSACQASYLPGTEVTLTATATGSVSVFAGWSGGCTGTGTCELTMDTDVDVIAEFDSAVLSVSGDGDGKGTITATPGEISCPGDCFEPYLPGTVVTLTATPAANAVFLGWGGSCSGTGACAITMNDDAQVTATFDTGRVAVGTDGDGGGSVTSTPSGIGCPSDCRESYLPGTQVTLTAVADSTSTFTGWTGDVCSGTGTCVVDAGSDPVVTASFDTGRLNVRRKGGGAGLITSDPAGIDCGDDCFERYLPGSTVTLTPTEQAGSTFAGWSGDCSGLGACVVTLDADRSVIATFNPPGIGGKITYECDYDVCVMNEDGTDQINLTNTPDDQEYAPTLSKDGTKIAFMSNAALTDNPDGNIEIATMNVDGTDVRQITHSESWDDHNYDPDWSPDGTKIAFVTTRGELQRQIYTINADGTNETAITSASDQVTRLGPKWSPDGTKIAYTWWLGGQDVYVMNADGTGQTNLTPDTLETRELSPSWSPDGTRLAFGTDRHYDPMTFNEEIYIVDADGTNFIRLTEHKAIDESPTWSPDGEWVAFSRYGDIYAVQAPPPGPHADWETEYEVKQLTSGPAVELEPYWARGAGREQTRVLKVKKTGSGSGVVTSSPAGIRCGKDCSESFVVGSKVNLVATPAYGSRVVGWSRPCPGSGSCLITVRSGRAVKVRFERVPVLTPRLDRLQ
jgi:Tol biopolymer transport system component